MEQFDVSGENKVRIDYYDKQLPNSDDFKEMEVINLENGHQEAVYRTVCFRLHIRVDCPDYNFRGCENINSKSIYRSVCLVHFGPFTFFVD